ncbi:MAG TPA: hypothetical protein VJA17_03555 [Candidatus Omnitrophota bacterium]|nr:hypothetical protein [Candidatus Omnitrophota bacterium]
MLKKLNINKPLHILIVEDKKENVFIAHCLDMDIAAQGKSEKEAVEELKFLIKTQLEYCLENDMLDTAFHSAPKEYWDQFYSGSQKEFVSMIENHKVPIRELTSRLEVIHAG